MKIYFAYIRVSTPKQGQQGVSLAEQRSAIEAYAMKHGLEIGRWFEERETAAKRGRPHFAAMLKLLKSGEAQGVVIHKIDRSARNLRDWADLGEMIDAGVEVHFAVESLDLRSRGGRLSADIQAVVSADFIRNLREETRKGFYGRLKQGVYPLPAPLGYRNEGKGRPKTTDPVAGPLVRRAFELYATGAFNLKTLCKELDRLGLRNRRGGAVTVNGLSTILNNPFYAGLMRIRRTGETFPGAHDALVPVELFQDVQDVLAGKTNLRKARHDFLFRRLFRCGSCGYALIGERQKGYVYYRCHTHACPRASVREEMIDEKLRTLFDTVRLRDTDYALLFDELERMRADHSVHEEETERTLSARYQQIAERLDRLTDAYVDGLLDKTVFEERRGALLVNQRQVADRLADHRADPGRAFDRAAKYLERSKTLRYQYETGIPAERRELVQISTSNRYVSQKHVEISLQNPFQEIANARNLLNSDPYRDVPRTAALIRKLVKIDTSLRA